jgi:hypothetical protein
MNKQDLLQFSPYPVKEIAANPLIHTGTFTHDSKEAYIQITSSLPEYKKLASLAHELGHARHFKRHCKCYWDDEDAIQSFIIKELHAMKFELAVLLHLKARRSLKWVMREYSCLSDYSNKATQIVLRKLYQTKIYFKCKEFIKK